MVGFVSKKRTERSRRISRRLTVTVSRLAFNTRARTEKHAKTKKRQSDFSLMEKTIISVRYRR